MAELTGKTIAILATDGFEQVELTEPQKALKGAGAAVHVVAPPKTKTAGKVQGMNHDERGDQTDVDATLESAGPDAYDALILPGGVANPDALRIDPKAVAFVKHFVDAGKPIGVICHGGWTLIDAGGVSGKTMTSWPSLKTDLSNAGAKWVDREVVQDGMLVSSRKPDDLPAFCQAVVAMIGGEQRKKAA